MRTTIAILASIFTSIPCVQATGIFPGLEQLETENLPLRLDSGTRIDIRVAPVRTLHKTNTLVGGVAMTSLSRWSDVGMPYSMETGDYNLAPELEDAFIRMQLPTTRFYAITQDEPFDELEEALDAVASYVDRIKIPQQRTILELEYWDANQTYSPQEWAEAVSHCIRQGYDFRMWEIGNEVYSSIWGKSGKAFPEPNAYVEHFIAVSKAIKEVQPDALVGISVPRSNPVWGDQVLVEAAGFYDFVCPHMYGGFFNIEEASFEDVVINDNHDRISKILAMNRLTKQLNPNKETFIYDTEWGLHALKPSDQPTEAPGKADFQPRNGNIMGTIYRAVRLAYYAGENLVRGACGWKALTRPANPGFATLYDTEPELRSMLYWFYYYFNRTLHENVSVISGTTPYHGAYPLVPILATSNWQGTKATLMLVNGSWGETFPATIALTDFSPSELQAVILSDDDLDAYPELKDKSDFVKDFPVSLDGDTLTFNLPPHCIVFIELSR